MATQLFFSRSLPPKTLMLSSMFSRSFLATTGVTISASSHSSFSLLRRFRPLAAIPAADFRRLSPAPTVKDFSTRVASSSLNDPNPNWSNRTPKETILLDGCDFEHWLVVMENPDEQLTRDEIIDSYIKTLAMVVGSEEEARMKIYSVSTRCYFAFGCLVSEELSYKIKELPKVRWVLPDSYLDVKNKSYGGEPFIDGEAVPYDPKYHEEWIRNDARARERNTRNGRPRNFDRSRNFERRENNQNREFPNASPNQPPPQNFNRPPPPPPNNFNGPPPPPPNNFNRPPPPPNNFNGPPPPPPNNFNRPPPPPNNFNRPPPTPPNNFNGPPPPHNHGGPQANNYWGAPQANNYGGPSNSGWTPAQNNYGGVQPNAGGLSNNVHNN